MSSTPRLPSAVPGEPPTFANVLAHAPGMMAAFGALYARFWQQGRVSAVVKETTRIRNARITDCGY
ncbi:MAG: hypothetical protein RIC56_10655 [Pseudomonadales bacterium]